MAGDWAWQLHGSFFLFFAPAFKQCAARRTVQGWSPGTPLLASHKMSNGAPCGMQQCFFFFAFCFCVSFSVYVGVWVRAPFIFAPRSSSSKANKWYKNVFATVYTEVASLHSPPSVPLAPCKGLLAVVTL